MRKKMVEGEYQTDSWPKGPESSLCPLARPDIAMGHESQIEAWSVCGLRRNKTSGSHPQFASCVRRKTTVSKSETTCHRLLGDHPAERRRGLGCQGQRHRGGGKCTLDIPLHRRNLWVKRVCGRIERPASGWRVDLQQRSGSAAGTSDRNRRQRQGQVQRQNQGQRQ